MEVTMSWWMRLDITLQALTKKHMMMKQEEEEMQVN